MKIMKKIKNQQYFYLFKKYSVSNLVSSKFNQHVINMIMITKSVYKFLKLQFKLRRNNLRKKKIRKNWMK